VNRRAQNAVTISTCANTVDQFLKETAREPRPSGVGVRIAVINRRGGAGRSVVKLRSWSGCDRQQQQAAYPASASAGPSHVNMTITPLVARRSAGIKHSPTAAAANRPTGQRRPVNPGIGLVGLDPVGQPISNGQCERSASASLPPSSPRRMTAPHGATAHSQASGEPHRQSHH
jgi:hypothetical protein